MLLRKFVAILLLAVMVFNLTGYRVLFNYLEYKAQAQMVEKLDNNDYNKSALTEVKVALSIPYMSNYSDFERIDGSVVINGVTYNYVERKIQNDTLILHCIPNNNIDNVKLASAEFGKTVNDIQATQKGQKSTNTALLLKSLECAGFNSNNSVALNNQFITLQLKAYTNKSLSAIADRFIKSPEQPPDVA